MDKHEFIKILSSVTTAQGKRAYYKSVRVRGNEIEFTRELKDNTEVILISELFNLYNYEDRIDTVVAKNYISKRVYSPSVAILKAAGLINDNGFKLNVKIEGNTPHIKHGDHVRQIIKRRDKPEINNTNNNNNDESLFFLALNTFLGTNKLFSKSIGMSIDSSDIYLSDDFTKYRFKQKNIVDGFYGLLKTLGGTINFNNKSLAHYIDGLIHNHPILGTRIVEFDEEQHFTPARKDSLLILSSVTTLPYADRYIKICNDPIYFNNVLKKHRINTDKLTLTENFLDFRNLLNDSDIKVSGYIEAKPAFNFIGGRIAQRAYFDSLRDVAHLSEFNKRHNLKTPIRFAKYTFEKMFDCYFSKLNSDQIIKGIKTILKEDYNIT